MPVIIPNSLSAAPALAAENISVLPADFAQSQEIRPLTVAILNLMPTKEATEAQFLRLIGSTSLQVEPLFLTTKSYTAKNTPVSYLQTNYSYFDDIRDRKFDALIVTGAPVEQLSFADVQYWRELEELFDWARENVFASLFVCWGAQAALWHYHRIPKHPLPKKCFGIFSHTVSDPDNELLRGFDDIFHAPHSRHTTVLSADLPADADVKILSESPSAGLFMAASRDNRQLYITGHIEYDRETLNAEYWRDVNKGLPIEIPVNYYPGDNPRLRPLQQWKAHSHLLYHNWINFIYQNTAGRR